MQEFHKCACDMLTKILIKHKLIRLGVIAWKFKLDWPMPKNMSQIYHFNTGYGFMELGQWVHLYSRGADFVKWDWPPAFHPPQGLCN